MLKRAVLLTVAILFSLASFGQAGYYSNFSFVNISGTVRPVSGAVITVCTASATGTPCSPKATIYTDSTEGSSAANPFTSDSSGNFGFWAAPGNYLVTVTGSGINGYSMSVSVGVQNNGPASFTSQTTTASGVFTNTQMNETNQTLINGLSPLAEFQAGQGGTNYGTDGLAVGVAVPNTSTVYQANGLAGYATSAGTTSNVVSVYGSYRSLADNAKGWSLNAIAMDNSHPSTLLNELDVNVSNAGTTGSGLLIDGAWTAQPSSFPAIHIAKPGAEQWTSGLAIDAGAALSTSGAIDIYQQATGNSQPSMRIDLWGMDGGGTGRVAYLTADLNGNLLLTPNSATGTGIYAAAGKAFISDIFESNTANPASSGQIRLAHADAIAFRNNANSGNVLFGINASDQLTAPAININTSAALIDTTGKGTFNGVVTPKLTSSTVNAALTGNVNLASTDTIAFRNNANSGDILIGHNASDQITMPAILVNGNATIDGTGKGTFNGGLDGGSVGLAHAGAITGASSGNFSNTVTAAGLIAGGSAATLSGTGACASRSSQAGGSAAGQVTCTGTTGASTLTITTGITAPNGWSCWGSDSTHALAAIQTGLSTTAPTLTFSNVTASDVIVFGCIEY